MDIFCQIENKLKEQIIDQTKNFYLLHDGYPLLEGHLLLIPKKHVDCFLNLDRSLEKEFMMMKKRAIAFLKKYYCYPVIFEHGVAGQTIPHAHLHFLPTNQLISEQLEEIGVVTTESAVPYLYYETQSEKKYYLPKKKVIPGLLHSYIYATLLKRPTNGILRSRQLSDWLLSVKDNYRKWLRN